MRRLLVFQLCSLLQRRPLLLPYVRFHRLFSAVCRYPYSNRCVGLNVTFIKRVCINGRTSNKIVQCNPCGAWTTSHLVRHTHDETISSNKVSDVENQHTTAHDDDLEKGALTSGQENTLTLSDKKKVEIVGRSVVNSADDLDLDSVKVDIVRRKGDLSVLLETFSLASIVDQSEFLSTLVKIGVDLAKIEKMNLANELVKLNFDQHVKPYILLFHELGIQPDSFGSIFTKWPYLFTADIEDAKVMLNYLESKKFSKERVAKIVTKAPKILMMKIKEIDHKLGYYQSQFHLTGSEVRGVVTRQPSLVTYNFMKIKDNRNAMYTTLGFSNSELKAIFLLTPRLMIKSSRNVSRGFDYVHNTMGIPHSLIVHWPSILTVRKHILENRHRFLQSIGRAQYDPKKENYISLEALVKKSDEEWCSDMAHTSYQEYKDFLKMI